MAGKNIIKEGFLVRHPAKPEWGLGKVLALNNKSASVYFKDDAKDYRKILLSMVDLEVADEQSDPMLDNLPPFVEGKFALKAKKVTIEAGIKAFTERFPLLFEDPRYLEVHENEAGGERNYKVRAHQRWLDGFGNGNGHSMLGDGDINQLRDIALGIVSKDKMNLLSPYEAMAFKDGLEASDDAAGRYFRALFAFVDEGPNQKTFNALSAAVSGLPVEEGRARVATWPVLTLLPFLADPSRFMFLKPEPTRACADRLRFDLLYDSALRWSTYERLMKMSYSLLNILKPLGARDFIDVQSFMWVIQKY